MPASAENELKINESIKVILKEMPDYVVAWHNSLYASKQKASTRLDYVRKIRKFLQSIDTQIDKIKLEQINEISVTEYYISIGTKEDSNGNIVETSGSYQQNIYSALNNFLSYLKKKNYIEHNYMEDIKWPHNNDLARINQNRIRFTKRDFKLVVHHADMEADPVYRYRDGAILRLFMSTGMRETALRIINISDIDFNKKILVSVEKRGKFQVYDLNSATIECLEKWLEYRKFFSKRPSDALFISYQGERLSTKGISKIVDKHCQAALGKHVSPHKLRGGFASIMFKETGNIEKVRRLLDHDQLETTQRYITTDNDERKQAADTMNF